MSELKLFFEKRKWEKIIINRCCCSIEYSIFGLYTVHTCWMWLEVDISTRTLLPLTTTIRIRQNLTGVCWVPIFFTACEKCVHKIDKMLGLIWSYANFDRPFHDNRCIHFGWWWDLCEIITVSNNRMPHSILHISWQNVQYRHAMLHWPMTLAKTIFKL